MVRPYTEPQWQSVMANVTYTYLPRIGVFKISTPLPSSFCIFDTLI